MNTKLAALGLFAATALTSCAALNHRDNLANYGKRGPQYMDSLAKVMVANPNLRTTALNTGAAVTEPMSIGHGNTISFVTRKDNGSLYAEFDRETMYFGDGLNTNKNHYLTFVGKSSELSPSLQVLYTKGTTELETTNPESLKQPKKGITDYKDGRLVETNVGTLDNVAFTDFVPATQNEVQVLHTNYGKSPFSQPPEAVFVLDSTNCNLSSFASNSMVGFKGDKNTGYNRNVENGAPSRTMGSNVGYNLK